jgi:hypothetical protein
MIYTFKLARRLAKWHLAAAPACLFSAACSDSEPAPLSPSSRASTDSDSETPLSALRVTPDSVQLVSGQRVDFSATAVFSDSSSGTVSVSPATSSLAVGGSVQLTAVAQDSAGGVLPGTSATWISSNPAVASVSASGLAKALGGGTATVTATVQGTSGAATLTVSASATTAPSAGGCSSGYKRLVPVSTSAQLAAALANALPGDKIALADGTYWGYSQWTVSGGGTADSPVLVCGTRRAVLDGGSVDNWSPLALSGAHHWIFRGFTITNSKIGIDVEESSDNVFDSLAIHDIGQEAVHLRNFSRRNVVQHNRIYNTGRASAAYGEGVYLGTAPNQWATYTNGQPDRSDSNRVVENVFGPGITSENIDIKAGTTGGVISGNVLSGAGYVAGSSSASPVWVSVKGSGYTVVGNSGSDSDRDGFEVKVLDEAPGWGNRNVFAANTANVGGPGYGFRIGSGTSGNVVRCSNVVTNAGAGFSNVACQP